MNAATDSSLQHAQSHPERPRPARWVILGVIAASVAFSVLAALLVRGWASGRRVELSAKILPATPPATKVPPPKMPEEPVEVTVPQRQSAALPGSNDSVFVRIGDITGGQALVTVSGADDKPLLPTVSLRQGRSAQFRVGNREYKVTAKKLTNLLVGDDFATLVVGPVSGRELTESEKIDRLIDYVATLDGATFVRNGREHTPAEAAEHMRTKRKAAGDRVKTADDFIAAVASRSSLSGEPYVVRTKDGEETTAQQLLTEELDRMENP